MVEIHSGKARTVCSCVIHDIRHQKTSSTQSKHTPSLTPQETLTYHALHSLIRTFLPANIQLRANIYNRFDINLAFVYARL